MDKITFVTALYNLKRDTLEQGFNRSMDQYFDAFKKLLNQDINLVIYCDKEVSDFVWKHRKSTNTKVIVKNIDFPFKSLVDKIRNTKEWYSQVGWLEQSPQAKLEYYNPLVMSKQFWLNDTSIHNYFNSKYFFWIDAGIFNTVNVGHFFKQKDFDYKLIQDVKRNKMLYLAFPYDGQNEVHGFKKEGMNKFAGKDTKYVCRGGFFGGTREAVNRVNEVYYRTLEDSLKQGYMGTEESVFTIITYRYPHYFNIQMINMNGLIGTYFHHAEKREERQGDEMAFYFLTFNAPEQIRTLLEKFKENFPNDFKESSKYLINNSTNKKLQSEYDNIIKEYDLIEHKFDNIGITGGRLFAADHFDKSNHQYMIFFEDDMLINGKDEDGKMCDAGFKKYVSNLFEKSIMILEENDLDYLKLSFSEFFGNNHDNWAWYNMDPARKEKFLINDDCPENKTRTFYSGSYKGLAYSVGEYFYCNWPILFSKKGNRKFFIEERESKKPHESALMAKMQTLLRQRKIKAGTLLASPITHKRFKHYSKSDRVENKYFKS
jgi:hypothetical protein